MRILKKIERTRHDLARLFPGAWSPGYSVQDMPFKVVQLEQRVTELEHRLNMLCNPGKVGGTNGKQS